MTHICVGNLTTIGSDNGLSPGRRQVIIWTNTGILLIEPLGTNFSEILIEIQTFSLKKIHFKMSSAKWRPFCLGLNVLIKDSLYFAAKECPTIPNIANAVHNGSVDVADRIYGAYIEYSCNLGFKFPDDTLKKIRTCDQDGMWSPSNADFPACECEFYIIIFIKVPILSLGPLDKMATISQRTLSNAFSRIKMFYFRFRFHHYLNQCWLSSLTYICGTRGDELNRQPRNWCFIIRHAPLTC